MKKKNGLSNKEVKKLTLDLEATIKRCERVQRRVAYASALYDETEFLKRQVRHVLAELPNGAGGANA